MRGHGTAFFGTIRCDYNDHTSDGAEIDCIRGKRKSYHRHARGVWLGVRQGPAGFGRIVRLGPLGIFILTDDGDAGD